MSTISKYLVQQGFSRLKELNPTYDYDSWYFKITEDSAPLILSPFYRDCVNSYKIENFDTSLIIGTSHPDYKGRMWIEMLGALKRYRTPDSIDDIKRIINIEKDISLNKINGNYYIAGGNHRFCIAKFIGATINRVSVTEYNLNEELTDQYNWFKERDIKVISICNNQWTFLIFQVIIVLKGDLLSSFMIHYEECKPLKKWYQTNQVRIKDQISLTNVNDFNDALLNELINTHRKRIRSNVMSEIIH